MTKKAKVNLTNVIAYLVGTMRYKLYYSSFKFLIRTHIQEQIDFRIKYMRKECYEKGECVICGCATTALQMANKACDAPCYPEMMSKTTWQRFLGGWTVLDELGYWFKWGNSLRYRKNNSDNDRVTKVNNV